MNLARRRPKVVSGFVLLVFIIGQANMERDTAPPGCEAGDTRSGGSSYLL